MNKTVRSLMLLYKCYGDDVPADDLLGLFAEGTTDINTQRRTLRRYLSDFAEAGIKAEWKGRGGKAVVHVVSKGGSAGLERDLVRSKYEQEISRRKDEIRGLKSRLAAEQQKAAEVSRRLERLTTKSREDLQAAKAELSVLRQRNTELERQILEAPPVRDVADPSVPDESDANVRDLALENAMLRARLETQSGVNDRLRSRLQAEQEASEIYRNMLRRR